MNASTCPECGATMKPGSKLCAACLLSAGSDTLPLQPVSTGIPTLPCDFGGYRLMKKLGSGGMGIVYEAEEIASGRRLALKVLNQSLDNEEQRQRFLREGRLAATIDHPHSVYVFGTEEIEGVPVIAMELAEGGTLRDEFKRRGPLPVREAVDAILGVLDGLEAAHAKGILHRDMKPSNCFVTGDGRTIVGDYGLSISQNHPAGEASLLTRSGMIMGTPAFSPPEQLRGQSLDQRADIYSTAGTLYYLLTGKAPVEAGSPVETVAAVLEGRITPPSKLRREVPADLSALIMRCMSADAGKRPSTHAEMRQLLTPFSSDMPDPAPLGLRTVAGVVDLVMIATLFNLARIFISAGMNYSTRNDLSWHQALWYGDWYEPLLVGVPYYLLLECVWGTTIGKRLCGLQVRRLQGGRPGIGATLLRAALILVTPFIGKLLRDELKGPFYDAWENNDHSLVFLVLEFLLLLIPHMKLLLFVPAIRRSDKAAWHDRLTGIRVVRRATVSIRKRAQTPASPSVATSEERWGPFLPGSIISPDWRHGHDPVLKRPVLLQRRTEAAPTAQRLSCNRGGRLRWLQTVTDPAGATWDAWQSPAGAVLSSLIQTTPPAWSELVSWMRDLAAELDAAQKDHTLPDTLSLSQVWITADGRAMLLDAPWPGTAADDAATSDPQAFLHRIASLAPTETRPLHADNLMKSLASASFERLSHVAGNLSHVLPRRAEVNRFVRAACLIGPLLLPLISLFTALIANDFRREGEFYFTHIDWLIPNVRKVLTLHQETARAGHPDASSHAALEHHLIKHWSWRKRASAERLSQDYDLTEDEGQALHAIIRREAPVMDTALADAEVDRLVKKHRIRLAASGARIRIFPLPSEYLPLQWLILIVLWQGMCILVCGSPLLMRFSGVAAVTPTQRPASRLRMMWRWLIGWLPVWGAALVMILSGLSLEACNDIVLQWAPIVLLLMLVTFLPLSRRSLVDRLAGTWLVAR